MTRALVITAAGEPPQVREVSVPDPGPGQVRVRIAAAGVCHSDLSFVNGTLAPQFPVVIGHEASGVVDEVGPGVTRVAVGDPVVLNWAAACGQCWYCGQGEPWLCTRTEGPITQPGGELEDGTQVYDALGIGAFAEEIVVGEHSVVPLPDGVPLDVAAVLGCAVLTGVGAVRNTAGVTPGSSVLVIGQGGIGLSAVIGARLAGADRIIAVDVNGDKEALARAAGATDFLVSDPTLAKAVRALTDGRGVDFAFDCVGAAGTIRTAWSATRRGGTCVVVGVGPRTQEVTFNPLELYHFGRNLTGSIFGSSDPDRDIPVLGAHVRSGDLDLEVLVSHRINLDQVPEAFERMQSGEGARSLIIFDTATA